MNTGLADLPYCGTPPAPAELWSRWNLDPVLLFVLAALMLWHGWQTGLLRSGHAAGAGRGQRVYFIAGWSALVFGLISPICALSVALFSARVTQHMWLALIAAPLLVLAGSSQRMVKRVQLECSPLVASGVFALCLWAWHAPRLYALTFVNDLAYWLMHITLFGSALLLWRAIATDTANALARAGSGFIALLQMGLLGALITLAPRSLYMDHVLSAPMWGLSALEDQQLGGLIMWIPAGIVLAFAVLGTMLGILRASTEAEAGQARAGTPQWPM